MRVEIRDFLLYCKTIDFGKIKLSKMESTFYQRFNNENLSLCRSLPQSAQTDSILFLMQYSGLKLGDELDFFANHYPPSWSIGDDIGKGSHSAIYFCLPKKLRSQWETRADAKAATKSILIHILEHNLIDKIKERICTELETAASIAEAHNMAGLAGEFRCLSQPLGERWQRMGRT